MSANSMLLGTLGVKLDAATAAFEKKMAAAQSKIEGVAETAKKVSKVAGVAFAATGGAIYAVAKTAGDFEYSMARVGAVSQATAQQQGELSAAARKYAAATQFTAKEVADGMSFMAMAGFKSNQIVAGMPSVLNLASAGMIDLATASDITTNIVSGMGLKMSDLAHANDVLVSAMTGSNVNTQMLGEAFKYVGPVAKTAEISFEDITAAIGKLGNVGIQGSMAGTTLRMAIAKLVKPTKETSEELDRLGVKVKDASGKLLPLDQIIKQLEPHADDTASILKIFGIRAGPGMAALVGAGADSLKMFSDRLRESEGLAERISKKVLSTFNGQMDILKSKFQEAQIAIGQGLMPYLRKLNNVLQNLLNIFNSLSPEMKATVGKVLAIASAVSGLTMVLAGFAALLPSMIGGIGMIASAIASALLPVVMAIGGIAVVIASVIFWIGLFKKAWDSNLFGIHKTTVTVVNNIKKAWVWLVDVLTTAWEFWADVAKSVLLKVTNWFEDQVNAWIGLGRMLGEALDIDTLKDLEDIEIDLNFEDEKKVLEDAGEFIAEKIKQAGEFLVDSWGEGLDFAKEALGPLFDGLKETMNAISDLTKGGGGGGLSSKTEDASGLPTSTTEAGTDVVVTGEVSTRNAEDVTEETGAIIGAVTEGLDSLGRVLQAFAEGGPIAAIIAIVAEALQFAPTFGKIITKFGQFLANMGKAFEPLLDALWPLIDTVIDLASVVLTLLIKLFPLTAIIVALAPVISAFASAVNFVVSGIIGAYNWVVDSLASVASVIPIIGDDIAKFIRKLRLDIDTSRPAAAETDDAYADMTDSVLGFGDEVDNTTEAMRELNEELSNIPRGFKVLAARFKALDPEMPTTTAVSGMQQTQTASGGGRQAGTVIEAVYIQALDPDDAYQQLKAAADRDNFMTGGTVIGAVGRLAVDAKGGL